jgi:hypothetical protein
MYGTMNVKEGLQETTYDTGRTTKPNGVLLNTKAASRDAAFSNPRTSHLRAEDRDLSLCLGQILFGFQFFHL